LTQITPPEKLTAPTLIEKKATLGYKQSNQKAMNIPMTISEEE
jgi:hypothetical protein